MPEGGSGAGSEAARDLDRGTRGYRNRAYGPKLDPVIEQGPHGPSHLSQTTRGGDVHFGEMIKKNTCTDLREDPCPRQRRVNFQRLRCFSPKLAGHSASCVRASFSHNYPACAIMTRWHKHRSRLRGWIPRLARLLRGAGARELQLPAPCEARRVLSPPPLRKPLSPVLLPRSARLGSDQPVLPTIGYSCPRSGRWWGGGHTVQVLLRGLGIFLQKDSESHSVGCGGSAAAQLLFCPICTCQLINCASRRFLASFPQRRLGSAYQRRVSVLQVVNNEPGSTMTSGTQTAARVN